MDEKQQQKQTNQSGARQEPRHPPARCPETRQRNKQPDHNMIQSSTLRLYTLNCLMP